MPDLVSPAELAVRDDLPEWRYLLGRIEATFRVGSFGAAARLVQEIASAGDQAGQHPGIDLRFPDRVHVALSTVDLRAVTDLDTALALEISRLAAAADARSEPLAGQALEVAIDAIDIDAIRPFWKAALGYVDDAPEGYTGRIVAIKDPAGIGPPFWFQQMDEPRPQRNRFHIDVTVAHDAAASRISAALAAGGTVVTDQYARSWWVLADSEGNEACICTWQDRSR